MKLAYSSNAYMRWPVNEAIRRIGGLGYRGVELMADRPHAWPEDVDDDAIESICGALKTHDLAVSNVNAFMMNAVRDFWHPSWIEPDAAFRRLRIEHTKKSLTLARKIGARCVTTEPGGPIEPGMSALAALDTFVEGLHEVLPHAEAENVLLLVEPEPGLLIENADQFERLAGRIDSPFFGLNFDIGHFFCVSEPLPETVERLQRFTKHYHVEDIAASRVHEHLIPGSGAIDFPAVFDAIRATGYAGWLTVELYPYLDDPDGAGRSALSFLKPLLTNS